MAGVAAALVGGLALAGGAAARGIGESQSWMDSVVEEAKAKVPPPSPVPPLQTPAPPPPTKTSTPRGHPRTF